MIMWKICKWIQAFPPFQSDICPSPHSCHQYTPIPRVTHFSCNSSQTFPHLPSFSLLNYYIQATFSFCLSRPPHSTSIASKAGSRNSRIKWALSFAGSFLSLHYWPLRRYFESFREGNLKYLIITILSCCWKPFVVLQSLYLSSSG